jgi:single-strand DNA-binding protein
MFFVQIAGNLGKDPESKVLPSGQKITNFSVAIKQRKGKEEVTTWVKCVVWGDRFDKMFAFLKKGSSVIVCGKLNIPSTYQAKDGTTQVALELVAEMIEFSPFGKPAEKTDNPSVHKQESNEEEDLPF